MAKLRITKSEATADGTGFVNLDIWAVRDDGTPIGSRHTTLQVPAEALQAVLDIPNENGRNVALKALLTARLNSNVWGAGVLETVIAADDASAETNADMNSIVSLPADFDL